MTRKLGAIGLILAVAAAACSQERSAVTGQPVAAASGSVPPGSSGTPASDRRDPPAPASGREAGPKSAAPEFREVTAPAGTIMLAELATPVSSETSKVEDPVRATLRQPLRVAGQQVLPAGTELVGHVTAANRSARVKGRASVAFRFTSIALPGDGERKAIRTDALARRAPATKKQDAVKIGGGAAGGALIGAIVGGGDGAAKGAAIGGAAGTGVVLSTRGKEVHLGRGADLTVRLAAPATFRVPVR